MHNRRDLKLAERNVRAEQAQTFKEYKEGLQNKNLKHEGPTEEWGEMENVENIIRTRNK